MFKMDKDHKLKIGLAEMLKGGVIMDVVSVEHAVIAAYVDHGLSVRDAGQVV